MDDQTRFRTALAALLASAEGRDRKLGKEDVEAFFRDMELEEGRHQLVYAYLASKKIQVEGVDLPQAPVEEKPLTAEEQTFLKQYQKDMRSVPKRSEAFLEDLAERASDGDEEAKRLLIEQYMDRVLPIARTYVRQGLLLQDLVQEGNLGLTVGADTLGLKEEGVSWNDHLIREIHRAIQGALEEQAGSDSTGEQITEKLNRLADSITELTEDMGRQVTPEELSWYLDMPMEELEGLLRIAGEQIETADGR